MKKISLVMGAYNKKELLRLGLESLKNQSFDFRYFELVLVDDASTDGLKEMVLQLSLPFVLKLVILPDNTGRSRARNTGIRSAEGDIVILTDADCLFPRDYITQHWNYHQANPYQTIITGAADYYPLYTYYYPDFQLHQKQDIPIILEQVSPPGKYKKENIDSKRKFPLARVEDIALEDYTKFCIRRWKGLFNPIRKIFGYNLESFPGRWMSLVGINTSVRRQDLLDIGLFEENFYRYGLEDWELGYRFYRAGYQFLCPEKIYNYHQEHPKDLESAIRDNIFNYKLFRNKFPNLEISLFSLALGDWNNWHVQELGLLYIEIEQLDRLNQALKKDLQEILLELATLYGNLLNSSLINSIKEKTPGSTFYRQVNLLIQEDWGKEKYLEVIQVIESFAISKAGRSFPRLLKLFQVMFQRSFNNP